MVINLSIHALYPGLAYKSIIRQKLHDQLTKTAVDNQIRITINYDQLLVKFNGPIDKIEKARIDTLIFADTLSGLVLETTKIPFYMINSLGGKRHGQYVAIMEETKCNIYFPTLWQDINDITEEVTIYIMGDTNEDVKRAITLIQKLLAQKIKTMCNSKSILNSQKRDYLLLYKKQELTKIMKENGSFICFSTFGSEQNTVEVYAENYINVDRTLRSLNYLVHVHVIYNHNHQLVITGSREQIQSAIQFISKLPLSQEYHESTTFYIELAVDQREFISGKKNGKINKIMKTCDTHIDFHTFNQFNFLITIESNDFSKARDGFDSLQDELPAEISFYVPEICHRRIIGVAGKNIQRVMKQYGVYVKFSSHEELATFGGYFENEHNVIARTPQKNKASLELLKLAVMNFIPFQKDKDYTTKKEYVPYYVQRQLLHSSGKYLREKARLYNTKLIWPQSNGTEHVLMIGPQAHMDDMSLRIQSLLPQHIHIQVPASVALERILQSEEIEDLEAKIFKRTGIYLLLPEHIVSLKESSTPLFVIEGEGHSQMTTLDSRVLTFKFCFDYNTKHHLQQARAMFDAFMGSRFVPLDDTLHNMLNGSPSPEDMQHISPSVMHLIDHPESYEHNKRHVINDSHNFFQPWGNGPKKNNNFQLNSLYDAYAIESDYPSSSCSSNSNSSNNRFQFVPDYTPFSMNHYSRQRSTSLLPTSNSTNSSKYYPSGDYYYPLLDRKIPSSSLSTPIPHQRNNHHRIDPLLFNVQQQQGRFNP
ncbi:hypothetical protein G6F29_011316 [Rhizopus arrhizus]|uniref:K Homology domain-containing protein n=1 Tax=Rhizopus oryzae TaxID=64495 RepID=A0A9P6X0B2_RHIOR|nr:hypothetical protein G6F23_007711 [Rhizopus arrhizus]KAG1411180.1 hypothetical protein G6F58_008699 [Rhizopus delemar]KAG0759969.1 hypothetical protein G6F24_008677 [Rhizopus arrhizus]KAG0787621.1 hypothetical protein G6F21_007785 [Rhizopus arrhizus]KAG0806441.1 hypothetical protein G6F20_011121 [Rhizopus arrhizus]